MTGSGSAVFALLPDGVPVKSVLSRFQGDEALYPVVEKRIRDCCAEVGLDVLSWIDSPIQGGDGNREFFIDARRAA